MRNPARILFLAVCTPIAAAQTTYFVGPSGLPEIRDAVAVAVTGDTILVEPGLYAHFETDQGVTIRATVPGTVTVAYDPTFPPANCTSCAGIVRIEPPAGETVHLVDLDFRDRAPLVPTVPGTSLQVTGGRVTLDRCTFRTEDRSAVHLSFTTAHLQDCELASEGPSATQPALLSVGSDVTIVGGSYRGASSPGVPTSAQASPGIVMPGSRLHVTGAEITGGTLAASGTGAAGMFVPFSATAWLTDCTIVGGLGSCAVAKQGAAVVQITRCNLTDGPNSSNCLSSVSSGAALGVRRMAPLAAGNTFALEFRTEPNQLVAVLAAPALDTLDLPAKLAQPWWLAANQTFPAALLISDANGLATASWPIPSGPGISNQQLWFQGLAGSSLPLATSAPVGGVAR